MFTAVAQNVCGFKAHASRVRARSTGSRPKQVCCCAWLLVRDATQVRRAWPCKHVRILAPALDRGPPVQRRCDSTARLMPSMAHHTSLTLYGVYAGSVLRGAAAEDAEAAADCRAPFSIHRSQQQSQTIACTSVLVNVVCGLSGRASVAANGRAAAYVCAREAYPHQVLVRLLLQEHHRANERLHKSTLCQRCS